MFDLVVPFPFGVLEFNIFHHRLHNIACIIGLREKNSTSVPILFLDVLAQFTLHVLLLLAEFLFYLNPSAIFA